ncbi:MAG: protein kinase [Myxococcota bacterium]
MDSDDRDALADLPWDQVRESDREGLSDIEARNRIRARLLGDATPELRVGRFRILRTLGRGAMGSVHAAFDDELQREIAIKVLHPDICADEAAQHRLIREAQAQAGLSHPHLVPVFEVGHHQGRIYLAMERVDGTTMTQWLETTRPPARRILAQWLDVARALVVVHREGLVHRDIKPDNVLVGNDQRVRLVDFGLARGQNASTDLKQITDHGRELDTDSGRTRLEEMVTQSHALVGTPVYMAPEVLRGEPASPHGDQYSLCVSIYESLVGRRPFDGRPRFLEEGAVERASLSREVYAVLSRGLAYEPQRRFPSTAALVAALEPIVQRRRQRRTMAAVGVIGALAVGGLTVDMLRAESPTPSKPCVDVDVSVGSVWNDERRDALRDAFADTSLPYAAPAGAWLERSLDESTRRWSAARLEVCEAREIDHSLSTEASTRAVTCLEQQRETLDGWIATVIELPPDRVADAMASLGTLPVPAECLRRARTEAPVEPPPEALRARVEQLARQLRRTHLQATIEGPRGHLEVLRQHHADAVALGYRPLVAEASMRLGLSLRSAEDPEARDVLERAANDAERVGDLGVRELALHGLLANALGTDADAGEARRALDRVWAVLGRMQEPPDRMVRALEKRALLSTMEGDYAGAEQDLRSVIELAAELGPAHIAKEVIALHYLGSLLAGRGRTTEATEAFARADERATAMGVPTLVTLRGALLPGRGALLQGLAMLDAGKLDEATRMLEVAGEQSRQAFGADSVPMARVHMAQAKAAMTRGKIDDVLAHAQAADEKIRRWLGDDNALRIDPLSAVGTVAFYQGDVAASVAAFEEAVRLAEASLPHTGLLVARHRSNLGEALVLAGDDSRAEALLRAALESMEGQLDAHDPQIALPAQGLAEIAWRAKNLEQAARYAQRALEIREHHDNDPPELARTRWLLARIEDARGNGARAKGLAEQARQAFESLGPAFAEQVQEIERHPWNGD